MKKYQLRLILAISIIYGLIASSCEPKLITQQPADSPVPITVSFSPTVAPRRPTATIPPLLTATTENRIVAENPSSTPTIAATSVPPTLTPAPTLTTKQAQEKVFDLLMNNAGCELPCYWGITPGETTWQDALIYLASFSERFEGGNNDVTASDGNELSYLSFEIRNTIPEYEEPVHSDYIEKNGIIDSIFVPGIGTELRYQVHQVLDRYGLPDEVLVILSEVSPTLKPSYSIYIIYEERGVSFYYYGVAQMKDDTLKICPEGVAPDIFVITPGSITLSQMIQEVAPGLNFMDSINNFPGKDIEYFYETLKEPGSCILFNLAGSN